jgi:hypothetical protein
VYARPNFADPKAPDIEGWGVFFFAGNGSLQVNRMGWALRPTVGVTRNRVGPEPPPGAGNVQTGTAAAAAPGAAAGGGGGRGRGGPGGPGGGRGGGKPAPELTVMINPKGAVEEDYPLHVHTRDFLDKLKAKNRATNAPLEVGYNSALPCVLALEAMQQNRVLGWDATARKSKAL